MTGSGINNGDSSLVFHSILLVADPSLAATPGTGLVIDKCDSVMSSGMLWLPKIRREIEGLFHQIGADVPAGRLLGCVATD